MGGTDVICGISHLPVQDPDPAWFIFLRQPAWPREDDWNHQWARWVPVGLPVRGRYNFYGYLEDVEHTPVTDFVVELMSRHARPLSEDQVRGYGDLEDFPNTIESLMSACERGWLTLDLPDGDDPPGVSSVKVSPFYVSDPMFRAMTTDFHEPKKGESPSGVTTWRRRTHERMSGAVKMLRESIEWGAKKDARGHGASLEKDDTFEELLERTYPMLLRDLVGGGLDGGPDVLVSGRNWKPDIFSYRAPRKFRRRDWKEFESAVTDICTLHATLNYALHREFYPTVHRTQYYYPDDELVTHRLLLLKIEERCREIERAFRERSEEDEIQ
jgi:hypothetical protein